MDLRTIVFTTPLVFLEAAGHEFGRSLEAPCPSCGTVQLHDRYRG